MKSCWRVVYRNYCDFLKIPQYNKTQLNEFFSMCIAELPKNGYEVSVHGMCSSSS
jgi:hypothetical protein